MNEELTCYVRVTAARGDDFVQFEFAVGEPELAVELVLRLPQFEEFCARHRAVRLDEAAGARLDHERMKWRYGVPGMTD